MAPSLARVAARLEMLSRAELLDIAARGCVENKEVCRYADVLLAKRAPLPEWAVERVLLSPDLLEHVVSALPLVDLSSAAVCSTWRSIWARSLKVRRVLRPSRRSAEADLGLPWKSFAPEGARPESMLVLPGWGGSEPVVCLGYSMPPRVVHVLVDTEVATEHTMTGDHVGWLSSLAADNEHLYAITYRGARPVDHAGGGSYVTRFQISGSRIQRINERAVQYAREATVVRGGPFFVVLADGVLHALDRLSLLTQFTVAREVLGIMSEEDSWAVEGLTSCGTEIFLSNQLDHTLRVLSASGEPIRTIANGGWNFAKGLCAIEDRIFITEVHYQTRLSPRPFLVLSPALVVYPSAGQLPRDGRRRS